MLYKCNQDLKSKISAALNDVMIVSCASTVICLLTFFCDATSGFRTCGCFCLQEKGVIVLVLKSVGANVCVNEIKTFLRKQN